MKTISKTALVALTLVAAAIGGNAQAHTEWRYSFKGGMPPYAVPHEHERTVSPTWKAVRLYAKRKHHRAVVESRARRMTGWRAAK